MSFYFFLYFLSYLTSGYFHIVTYLQIKPEFRLNPEIFSESQRCVCSDFSFAMNNLTNTVCRHINVFCQLILRNFHRLKKFF